MPDKIVNQQAFKTARLQKLLLKLITGWQEIEEELQDLEAARGLPASQQLKPLTERLADLGMHQAAINNVQRSLRNLRRSEPEQ